MLWTLACYYQYFLFAEPSRSILQYGKKVASLELEGHHSSRFIYLYLLPYLTKNEIAKPAKSFATGHKGASGEGGNGVQ